MNINEKIYTNVKALSKLKGKDMKDVEAAIGRSVGYLSRKATKVSVDELVKLAEVFDVATDSLMFGNFDRELQENIAEEELIAAYTKARGFFSAEEILSTLQAEDEQHE